MKWFTRQSKGKKALVIALIISVICMFSFSLSVFAESSGKGKAVKKAEMQEDSGSKKSLRSGADSDEEIVYVMNKPDGSEYQRIVSANGDLHYEGYEDCILPLNMTVTYKLDGEKISPDELAGQIGHVEIDIRYKNNLDQGSVCVPFVAITGMILDNEDFSNVTVDNGKAMDDGSRTVVMGYAMPGLSSSLDNDLVDLDIPEDVHIEADTTNYEVEEIYTIASSSIFANLEDKGSGDLDDLTGKLDELSDGMDELSGGMSKMAKAAGTLNSGAGKLKKGSTTLAKGTGTLADGTSALHKAVKSDLAGNMPKLVKGSKKLKKGSAALSKGISDTSSDKSLVNGAAALKDGSKQLADGTAQLEKGVNELAKSTPALKEGAAQVDAGVKELAAAASAGSDTSELDASISQIESQTKCKSADDFDNAIAGLIAAMAEEGADTAALTKQIAGLSEAKGQWEVLQQMKAKMEASGSEKQKAQIAALVKGASELANGTAQLDASINQSTKEQPGLKDSVASLNQGAGKLSAGASSLNDGVGVVSKNMKAIAAGNKTLYKSLKKLQGGTDKLAKNTGKLKSGAAALDDGASQLAVGLDQLADGTDEFSDAIHKASGELKDKLSEMDTEDLDRVLDNFDSLKAAAKRYKSFEDGGSYESVTFIYKMDEVAEE